MSKEQDVKNPQTKGSSFSAQVWITETASSEAAGGACCQEKTKKKSEEKNSVRIENLDIRKYNFCAL